MATKRRKPSSSNAKRSDFPGTSPLEEFKWLGEVRKVNFPLSPLQPIIVRSKLVTEGSDPRPSMEHPEQHPYYEMELNIEGDLLIYIGKEKVTESAGDIMLIGPGIPHYAYHLNYPRRAITVHFLPTLLLEMGPEEGGARVLSRFTAAQNIGDRIFQVPAQVRDEVFQLFTQMAAEYDQKPAFWELKLRALLIETLVKILRWEESSGKFIKFTLDQTKWSQIGKSLHFIHQNYASHIYVKEIAQASGMTVDSLQSMFRNIHGISCIHYLQAYRIIQAKGLLCTPGMRVTDAAMAVGFSTLSHFNSAFRSVTGLSPTEYVRKMEKMSNDEPTARNSSPPARAAKLETPKYSDKALRWNVSENP